MLNATRDLEVSWTIEFEFQLETSGLGEAYCLLARFTSRYVRLPSDRLIDVDTPDGGARLLVAQSVLN